jgi:hypothetical protein
MASALRHSCTNSLVESCCEEYLLSMCPNGKGFNIWLSSGRVRGVHQDQVEVEVTKLGRKYVEVEVTKLEVQQKLVLILLINGLVLKF